MQQTMLYESFFFLVMGMSEEMFLLDYTHLTASFPRQLG